MEIQTRGFQMQIHRLNTNEKSSVLRDEGPLEPQPSLLPSRDRGRLGQGMPSGGYRKRGGWASFRIWQRASNARARVCERKIADLAGVLVLKGEPAEETRCVCSSDSLYPPPSLFPFRSLFPLPHGRRSRAVPPPPATVGAIITAETIKTAA
jgi:hypothetical protein